MTSRDRLRSAFDRLPSDSTLALCGMAGFAALQSRWTEAHYACRAQVVGAEDREDDVFFVLEGRARAATFTDGGREVRLSDITMGEGFGIFAAIDGKPRSTNVIAVEPSRFARISGDHFRSVLYGQPDVARAFMLYLCDRVRELSRRVTEVATLSAEQRLVMLLVKECRLRLPPGTPSDADAAVTIDPVPTQQDLAHMIHSQRETVGRELSRLARLGLVQRDGRTLHVPSLARLRAHLGEDAPAID